MTKRCLNVLDVDTTLKQLVCPVFPAPRSVALVATMNDSARWQSGEGWQFSVNLSDLSRLGNTYLSHMQLLDTGGYGPLQSLVLLHIDPSHVGISPF